VIFARMPWPEHTQLQCHRRGHRHGQQDHVPPRCRVGRAAEQAGACAPAKAPAMLSSPGDGSVDSRDRSTARPRRRLEPADVPATDVFCDPPAHQLLARDVEAALVEAARDWRGRAAVELIDDLPAGPNTSEHRARACRTHGSAVRPRATPGRGCTRIGPAATPPCRCRHRAVAVEAGHHAARVGIGPCFKPGWDRVLDQAVATDPDADDVRLLADRAPGAIAPARNSSTPQAARTAPARAGNRHARRGRAVELNAGQRRNPPVGGPEELRHRQVHANCGVWQ